MNITLKFSAIFMLSFSMFLSPTFAAEDDGSTLKIIAPHNGGIVSCSFDLTYELSKGSHGDHVHTYLDGKY